MTWRRSTRSSKQTRHITLQSPYAAVTVRRLLRAVDRLQEFPHSGRAVPEFNDPEVREVVMRPYRIVYRIVSATEIHVLTVHHGSRETLGAV
jgi:toxin ParE1/3/4